MRLPGLAPAATIAVELSALQTAWAGRAPTWTTPWAKPGGDVGEIPAHVELLREGEVIMRKTCVAFASVVVIGFPGTAFCAGLCFGPHSSSGQFEVDRCGEPPVMTWLEWVGFDTVGPVVCSSAPYVCVPAEWWPGWGPTTWTISQALNDPWQNVVSLSPGPHTLYVWLTCMPNCSCGITGTRFSLSGDIQVTGYTSINGSTVTGSLPDLEIQTPCTGGPIVLAFLHVIVPELVSADPLTWGKTKATYRR